MTDERTDSGITRYSARLVDFASFFVTYLYIGPLATRNRKKLYIYIFRAACSQKKNASQIIVKSSYKTASASAGTKHHPLGVRPALASLQGRKNCTIFANQNFASNTIYINVRPLANRKSQKIIYM